ncbi:hypothetical protein G6F22_019383 [Rhizopus arrhizus]|nr:hypothetical protein G6F22_019383 [Rhizopus arrhizus]KAG1166598.1 hypothetical protein G6F35_018099 [Rhizopus arrhizus]
MSAEASPVRSVPPDPPRAGAAGASGCLHRVRTRRTRTVVCVPAHAGRRAGGCRGHRAGLHGAADPLSCTRRRRAAPAAVSYRPQPPGGSRPLCAVATTPAVGRA